MDKKLRETTKLCVEITNRKQQVMKREFGHVVQIRVCSLTYVNVMLNLSNNEFQRVECDGYTHLREMNPPIPNFYSAHSLHSNNKS